jgi:hypothetical protein
MNQDEIKIEPGAAQKGQTQLFVYQQRDQSRQVDNVDALLLYAHHMRH